MTLKEVCDKLDTIITLLSEFKESKQKQQTEQNNELEPVEIKHSLNRSKYVNDEQRKQILNYIRLPKVVNALNQLPKHKQQSALQTMIKDDLNITVSYYMCSKLVSMIHNEPNKQKTENVDCDDEIPIETTKINEDNELLSE